MPNRRPVLYRHHIHTALNEAVKLMTSREEAANGVGWKSTEREVLEDALEAMNHGKPIDIRNYDL